MFHSSQSCRLQKKQCYQFVVMLLQGQRQTFGKWKTAPEAQDFTEVLNLRLNHHHIDKPASSIFLIISSLLSRLNVDRCLHRSSVV